MDKDLFFKHLRESFAFRDREALEGSMLFKEHRNWGSITSLLTVAMFFSEYGVHISDTELVACDTFDALYHLVSEKTEELCIA